ncbi:ubiquinol-cytochrome c reductase cytochrome b subunit [Streptomyces sp. RS10V-4]|uniref:cytochrome bc1 complex cytochrome b subunit n=1 Tax=Streptomyces rhizoryzae TaxID=2932493 RepID=UPI00200512D6|nr:ubiquinol-cytochrome c reductase cytochrome b subunit [Streptomyces rhizoryzae]MCK7624317.1 ubiquinol-cytochrome c reductase cytochrome b subunit [Streptomyces rhizoryzae]
MLFRKPAERMEKKVRETAFSAYVAVDGRAPASEAAKALLRKAFPDHWSFLLGEIALYSLLVLLLTGSYLTMYFEPSMSKRIYDGAYGPLRGLLVSDAYASTLRISFEVRGGLLIRQMHHWAALVFISALGVHMLRIFFTGAFRRPRELNWAVGVTLFMLSLLEGFGGYSLPDDLLSGTGLRTANTIVLSLPLVGTYLSYFLWGGSYPGHILVPRLYTLHVLFVPGLILALLGLHLLLVVYLKHTHWPAPGRSNRNAVGQPMFPQFTAKSTGLFLMVFSVMAVLGAVAQINPVWSYGPYVPDQSSTDVQPDWYVGFLEGALRLMPPWESNVAGHTFMWNVLIPAVILPGLLFLILYAYPAFERWVTGDPMEHHVCDRPRNFPTRTALGVAAIVFYGVLLAAGGNDVIATLFRVSVETLTWILRVLVVIGPILAFLITKRACLALQDRDRELLEEGQETGEVVQSVYGHLTERSRPLEAAKRYRVVVRDLPKPLPAPGGQAPVRHRVRAALSAWYYRDRVDMPVTVAERLEISAATKGPVIPSEEERPHAKET